MELSKKLKTLDDQAIKDLRNVFDKIDEISQINTEKVLASFKSHRVSDSMFAGSTGYGYTDNGRDTLDAIYADVLGAESAFCRHNIVNGTQAISIGLFGLLRPGDVMLSITGRPYDTLSEVIGDKTHNGDGSLYDFGVTYDDVEMKDGKINFAAVEEKIKKQGEKIKVIFVQRSKGYAVRPTLSAEEIGEAAKFCHERSKAYFVVDNCYGTFCDLKEPTNYGADMIIGSLIKNAGGGLANCGGYIAGTKRAVELASYRLTTVGIGTEVGATIGENRRMFQGLFMAPHTVAQAKKTAAYASYIFSHLGYDVEPSWDAERHDIIQTVTFGNPDGLCNFCRGIQAGSPVDAFVVPEPWAMPGYDDPVIMAAGTFVSGASIEISADGPLRAPYTAYFQGGLTFESGRYAILTAAKTILGE